MKISLRTKILLGLALMAVSIGMGTALNPGAGAGNANIASADSCCGGHAAPAAKKVDSAGCEHGEAAPAAKKVADAGCEHGEAAPAAAKDEKKDADLSALQKKSYPIDTCVVTGEKLGGDMGEPVDYFYNGRLVRFCCKGCVPKFEKEPEKYLTKLDSAVIEKEKANYPLDTCVVSGEKLGGDMGEPIDYIVANRLVRLCCKGCIKEIARDPAKYILKVDAAGAGAKSAAAAPASPVPQPSEEHSGHGGAHNEHAGHQH